MTKTLSLILLLILLSLGLSGLAQVYVRHGSGGLAWNRFHSNSSDIYGEPSQIGTITDSPLREISGIAPSLTSKGLWWVHNDSGDKPRLYVINASGKLLGKYDVTGARNRDWEDLASGPGRNGSPELYIADIGDNSLEYDTHTIYRLKEPDLSKGSFNGATQTVESLSFHYPDGRHDAEAIFVDPKSGRPYIVTKTLSPPCGVYRFPLPIAPGTTVTLEKVSGEAVNRIEQLMLVTGAAVSHDGSRVIVRSYFTAVEITRVRSGPFESIFNSSPQTIKLPIERQGEAITYTADGRAIITVSEKLPAPIYQMKRRQAQ
jgi:hypothetical protein